jgi:hypothetical protein
MADFERALNDISAIRVQIARRTLFRGYGPATLAVTGILALLAAEVQSIWILNPATEVPSYLGLWIATATASVIIIGIEAVTRSRRVHSGLADEMIQSAVEQFLPAAGAGVLLTLVILRFAPESLWMLPGLWQIVFSLGIFASCRSLPRPMNAIGLWYLGTGLACLVFAKDVHAFSAWAMGTPFGVGQLLAAALLRRVGGRDEQE